MEMTLTICLECDGKVSTQAAACPHCGAPVTIIRENEQERFSRSSDDFQSSQVAETETQSYQREPSRLFQAVAFVWFVLCEMAVPIVMTIVGLVIWFGFSPVLEYFNGPSPETFVEAFWENPDAATAKYSVSSDESEWESHFEDIPKTSNLSSRYIGGTVSKKDQTDKRRLYALIFEDDGLKQYVLIVRDESRESRFTNSWMDMMGAHRILKEDIMKLLDDEIAPANASDEMKEQLRENPEAWTELKAKMRKS